MCLYIYIHHPSFSRLKKSMLDRSKWSGRVNPLAFLQTLCKCVMSGTTYCMCFNIQGNPLHNYDGTSSNYSSVIVKRLGVMSLGLYKALVLFHYSFIDAKNIKIAIASKALCDSDPTLVFHPLQSPQVCAIHEQCPTLPFPSTAMAVCHRGLSCQRIAVGHVILQHQRWLGKVHVQILLE